MTKEEENSKKTRNRIIKITIIIIIILLLLISCSVSRHYGRIGKYCKEDWVNIDNNVPNDKINVNDKLKFDLEDYTKGLVIYLEDGNYKLSFTNVGFKANKYTCKTSNAKIATCAVKDGYVVIYPKKRGKITLTVSAKANGYKYIAQTKVEIKGGSTKSAYAKTNKAKSKKTKTTKTTKQSTTTKITKSSNTTKEIKKSSDARLASLKANNGDYKLAPTFNPDVTEYVIVVPKNTDKINLSGKTNVDKAKVISGLGDITLTNDSTEVKIIVKAEDGTTKTYTVKINKKDNPKSLSTDATLKSLSTGGYTLNPSFDSNTFNYETTVPNSVTSLDLTAIANYSGALVTITGNNNFKVGKNQVKIKVTTENGDTNTYTITVNRLDKTKTNTNANLTSLEVEGYSFSPNFDENTYEYTLNNIIPKNITELTVNAVPADSTSKVTITGNKNLKEGENIISVTITSKDGVKKTYNIKVNKEIEEKLSDFYITSSRNYKAGYHQNSDNYKVITISSNILDDSVNNVRTYTTPSGETGLELSDGTSYITLEGPFDLEYIQDDSTTNSYAIKVSYSSAGSGKIKVTGYRKGKQQANIVNSYDINFNIDNIYYITLNAGEIDNQKGFFSPLSDTYELTLYEGEELDLSPYNEVFLLADKENCKSYKFIGYDTDKNTENPTYKLETEDNKEIIKPTITIDKDITLYAIFDKTNKDIDYKSSGRYYLTDVDIFVLPDGTKNFIYPGTEGSYIMTIKNTTGAPITLKNLNIEEDTICSSKTNCLNMGYIIKRYTGPNYKYYSPTGNQTNDYWILNKESNATQRENADGSYHHEFSLDLDSIKLENNEETEISLLWKWVHSDKSDTEIGNYVTNKNNNDIYKLTVSYDFDKEDKTCDVK